MADIFPSYDRTPVNPATTYDDGSSGLLSPAPAGTIDPAESIESSIQSFLSQGKVGNAVPLVPTAEMDLSGRFDLYFPGEDTEELYAQSQSGWEKAKNGVVKMTGLATSTFIQGTAGLVYGTVKAVHDGRFASLYDNELSKSLNKWTDSLENSYAHYKTIREREANWWEPVNLFSGNFFWDGIIKNLGFSLGAYAGGFAWSGLFKAIGLTSRLTAAGAEMAAKADATLGEVASLANAERLASATGKLGKLYEGIKPTIGTGLTKLDRGIVATMGSIGEGGIESFNNSKEFRKRMIDDFQATHGYYPSKEEIAKINEYAERVGNWSLPLNVALLSATNYVQLPKIFGSTYKGERQLINNVIRQDGKYISSLPEKGFGKFLYKAKNAGSLLFEPTEAFEEGSQFAIQTGTQHYFNRKYEGKDPSILEDGIVHGIKQAISTPEGTLNIFLGGISGAIMTSGIPTFGQTGKIKERGLLGYGGTEGALRNEAIKALNDTQLIDKLKEAYNTVKTAESIQNDRKFAVHQGDVLESKDLEHDYAHSFVMNRLKRNAKQFIIDEVEDLKLQMATDEGFLRLQKEGVIPETDTRETFTARMDNLLEHAESAEKMMKALEVKYKGKIDPETKKPLYTDAVIEKAVYAGSKILDYNKRISQLETSLLSNNIVVRDIVDELLKTGDSEKIKDIRIQINELTGITEEEKKNILSEVKDITELSLRKKAFIAEYDDIINNPVKYQEVKEQPVPSQETKPKAATVKIKTKAGDRDLETGTQYFTGRIMTDEKGTPFAPVMEIIGENPDGTIKVRTTDGKTYNLSQEKLSQYEFEKLTPQANKKINFVVKNWNTLFEHKGYKNKDGSRVTGVIEYSPVAGTLIFRFTQNGKEKTMKVRNRQFVPQGDYKQAMISPIGKISREQQQAIDDVAAEKEDIKVYQINTPEGNAEILRDTYNDVIKQGRLLNKQIKKSKEELAGIVEQLNKLRKTIEKGGEDKRSKKVIRFSPTVGKALEMSRKLSRQKEEVENRILQLEEQKDDLRNVYVYLQDAIQNVSELPVDTKELIEQLKLRNKDIDKSIQAVTKQLSILERFKEELEKTIDNVVKFVADLVDSFFKIFPNIPATTSLGMEWKAFHNRMKAIHAKDKSPYISPKAFNNLKALEDIVDQIEEDAEIDVSKETISEIEQQITTLQNTLSELESEMIANEWLIDKFQKAVEDYEKSGIEEEKMMKNEAIKAEIFKSYNKDDNHTRNHDGKYEPDPKKATNILPYATRGVERGKPYQERANAFGFKLKTFTNRDKIRGVYITEDNEAALGLKGLVEFIWSNRDSDFEKKDLILLVMTQENPDGSLSVVDENGRVITEGDLFSQVIFQSLPLPKFDTKTKEWKLLQEDGSPMFRNDVPDSVRKPIEEDFMKMRERIKTSAKNNDTTPHKIEASFGFPVYDAKLDDSGNPIKDTINYDKRTSVQDAGLITDSDLRKGTVIYIPTTSDTAELGTTFYRDAAGRTFLNIGNAYVPLQNRKHTKEEAEVIYKAILQLVRNGMKGENSSKIFDFLRSVVYWGVPETREGKRKPASFNSIFIDTKEGQWSLVLGKNEYPLPFNIKSIEENKALIISVLQDMYLNVNNNMVKDFDKAYNEVVDILPNGEFVTFRWQNYQTYLLSKEFVPADEMEWKNKKGTYPARSAEKVPLTTIISEQKDNKPNRHSIYFYVTDSSEVPIPEVKKKTTAYIPPKPKATEPVFDGKTENSVSVGGRTFFFTVNGKFDFSGEASDEKLFNYFKNIIISTDKGDYKVASQFLKNKGLTDAEIDAVIKQNIFNMLYFPEEMAKEAPAQPEQVAPPPVDLNKSPDEKSDDLNLRVATDDNIFQKEDWKKFEIWLQENFPNIPVYRVANIIRFGRGERAWGMFMKGAMYVYKNAEIGTGYHEVFEAVWKMFTSPEERTGMINEFKGRKGTFIDRESGVKTNYKDATDKQIKEQLAEEFRDYVQFKKIPPKPNTGRPFIVKMFYDLVNFVKQLFTGNKFNSRIEKLFNDLNTGKYKDVVPYESQLSFAKKGIINIDTIIPSRDAEFRKYPGITGKESNELLRYMTYLTVHKIVENDEDIFNISIGQRRDDLYDYMKKRIIASLDKRIENANAYVATGVISPQEAAPHIEYTENLKLNIEKQWDGLTQRYEERIKEFDIEFDENDELQINDENKIKESDYVDATKIDYIRKMNPAIKLLLSTIVERDSEGNPKRTSVNGPILLPFGKVYVTLMNKLSGAVNTTDMMMKLKELAEQSPEYRPLYRRLTKSDYVDGGLNLNKVTNTHGAKLLSAFWRTFKKQKPEVKVLYILENGEVVVGEANFHTSAAQLRDEYVSAITNKAKEGGEYFTLDYKRQVFVGSGKSVKALESDSAIHSFLKNLGIEFSVADMKTLSALHPKQYSKLKEVVNGIRLSIAEKKDIVTMSSKALNIHKRLYELGFLQALVNHPEFDSTFFNVNNDRTQTFIGTNPASDLYDMLEYVEDIYSLDGTQYDYLVPGNDVNSEGSVILSKIFDLKDGEKKAKKEDYMKVVYIGGTDNRERGKQKESAKLTYRERLVQEINMNLDGYYMNLVPGDASMEWAIYIGNHVDRGDKTEMLKIFRDYFIAELNLVKDKRKNLAKDRDNSEMRFFRDILGKLLHDKVVSSTKSSEETYFNNQVAIDAAIERFINEKNKSFRKTLTEYNILTETEEGISFSNIAIPNNLTEDEMNTHLTYLNVNFMIANIEMHKLLYGDPYQYNDELKRTKNFNSPRQAIVHDSPEINDLLNRVYNDGFDINTTGWINFANDYFNTVVFSDIKASDEILKYTPYDETDGGGIISLSAYKHFRVKAGEWTDDNERQYRYDMIVEKIDYDEDITEEEQVIFEAGNPKVQSTYVPIKPIVSGNKLNNNTFNDIVLDKFSLYPISHRLLVDVAKAGGKKNSNAIDLYKKMRNEKIDYAIFNSGRKVGAENVVNPYNSEGGINDEIWNTTKIPLSIFAIQSEVPAKEGTIVTRGTQLTKLATMDFMEAGVPVDFKPDEKSFSLRYKAWFNLSYDEKLKQSTLYKEIKNNESVLNAMMKIAYKNLLARLGIIESDGKFSITNRSKAAETLREEMFKREVNDNISDAISQFLEGKSVIEATPAYQQVRNILYSIADKEVVSPKINGGMKVQIPVTFLESERINKTEINGKEAYVSDELGFYRKDGKQVCEIMISRWFDSNMSDKELLKYLNDTEEGQKILSGVGFRIPTQKQNSIDHFVIKQFLPVEFKDVVVVPSQIVAKAGSDFDIDKLTVYLKNVIGKKKPKLVALQTDVNSTVKSRYRQWVINNAGKDVKKYVKFLKKDVVNEIKNRFNEQFKILDERYKRDVDETKRFEYNKLVQSYRNIYDEVISSQDDAMIMYFEEGSKLFGKLSNTIREQFFVARDMMAANNVNGPAEIQNYLELAQTLVDNYDVEADEQILRDMISIYNQELLVLGSTQEQIDSRKEEAFKRFREHKNVQITNIGQVSSEISSELSLEKEIELETIDDGYIDELVIKSGLMSVEQFGKLPILEQNTKEALENEYIQSLQNLISRPENFDALTSANSADLLKGLSKEVSDAVSGGTFNYLDVANMLDRTYMSSLRHAFVTGKYAIGIAAVNQTNHAQNQRQPIYIDKNRVSEDDRHWIGDAEIKFADYNRITLPDGRTVPTLSMVKDAKGKYTISDIISQFVDGYVDISKDPWIMKMGAHPNVAGTYLFLIKLGVPVKQVVYFMNQPIVRDYLRMIENAGYSWLFIDNFAKEIKSQYGGVKAEMNTIPSNLSETMGMNISKMNSSQREAQVFILDEFVKYAKMAEHMFHITQGSNFDTANINDPFIIFKKLKQLEKAQNTIFGSLDNTGKLVSAVDAMLENSFVGTLKSTIENMRNALAEILTSDKGKVRGILHKVLTPYVDKSDRDFIKLSQKAVADLFDYAMQNFPLGNNLYYNNLINDVLIKDGGNAKEIMKVISKLRDEIKRNSAHPLAGNQVIDLIQELPSRKASDKTVNNIKIRAIGNKVYEQNDIISAFRDLKDYLGANNIVYKKIIELAVLQSGLSRSGISFTSLIPYEDFEEIYNASLSVLQSISHLDNFYTLGVFQRNNWNSDEIVPYRSATWTKTKKYNPGMKFLPRHVLSAINQGKLPQVVAIPSLSRATNSKYIVYSWEKMDELDTAENRKKYNLSGYNLIKKVKSEMRKVGDYSYINRGLFERVENDFGPFETSYTNKQGIEVKNTIFKAINAWGDGHKANEFYTMAKKSVIDNGMIKVDEVTNKTVINTFAGTTTDNVKSEKDWTTENNTSKDPFKC